MTAVMFNGRDDVKGFLLADMLPEAYKRTWPQVQAPPPAEPHADPLVNEALLARSRSFAVRTGYPEGAAVETESGGIYKGVKVELSSFASQAERMAAASAFLKGDKKIVRIAIVGGKDQPETPRDINWDSMQALYKQNPELKIVHPDAGGNFQEQSFPQFLADHLLKSR
jgi:cytidine deaminase